MRLNPAPDLGSLGVRHFNGLRGLRDDTVPDVLDELDALGDRQALEFHHGLAHGFQYTPARIWRLIRTVFPKPGARVWYDHQRRAHDQLYRSDDFVEYSFMGSDPEAADNRWLREARDRRIPIIYFLGVAPGRYIAVAPTYIADWDPNGLKAFVGFGDPATLDQQRFRSIRSD